MANLQQTIGNITDAYNTSSDALNTTSAAFTQAQDELKSKWIIFIEILILYYLSPIKILIFHFPMVPTIGHTLDITSKEKLKFDFV